MLLQSAESRYNQWVREHYRFLLRSAWALTGSRTMAEDVVQDCFANAWKHREQLRDATLARAWLFQIMRRAAFRQVTPGMQSLVEEGLPVVIRCPPIAGRDELARGFRVVRLVRIPERRHAQAPEDDDEQHYGESGRCGQRRKRARRHSRRVLKRI